MSEDLTARQAGAAGNGAGQGDVDRAAAFRERVGLASLIDVHTHFMPERLLAAVRAYFDAAGPLIGRPWPIVYRTGERARVAALRSFGVGTFTAMLYPHKPGMARSLNDWAADFAARTPDCLHTATFFAEPSRRRRRAPRPRPGRPGLQVPSPGGRLRPERPAARRGVGPARGGRRPGRDALRLRSGARPVHRARPGRQAPRPPPPAPPGGRAPGHAGVRGVPRPRRASRQRAARHHAGVHAVHRAAARIPFPAAELPRLRDLGDRVLLGTDFPNIPYPYPDALESLERAGLGTAWLRAVCHDNAARLFAR